MKSETGHFRAGDRLDRVELHGRDPDEHVKARQANAVLDGGDVVLSIQVPQEFYVQATRSSRPDALRHDRAVALVEAFLRFPVAELTSELVLRACVTCERFGISYWDAAILEAARTMGCEVVLSEDFGPGTDYDGVRVENPFRDA